MKVKDLRKELEKFPDEMDVYIPTVTGDYTYGLVYSVKEVSMIDNEDIDHEINGCVIDEQ